METKKLNTVQKRSVEVIEFEDGTYELKGSVWNLDNLNSEEIEEAIMAWKRGELKEGCSIDIKPPRILKN